MKLPKRRGFKRYIKHIEQITVINTGKLQQDEKIKDKQTITKETLLSMGYISDLSERIKIL